MLFTGANPAVSPLATGHPLGLPAVHEKTPVETRVQPVAKQAKAQNDPGNEGHPPAQFWRAVSGQPDPSQPAPPSIMQLKILAMLDEQAARQREPDPPEAVETLPKAAEDPAPAEEEDRAASDEPEDEAALPRPQPGKGSFEGALTSLAKGSGFGDGV